MSAAFPFVQLALDASVDWFALLSKGVRFESVAKGREGAVLLACAPDGSAPIVRSTTKYRKPHQQFGYAHTHLADAVRARMPGLRFNNALIERYGWQYRSMGAHSDQAMDLADDSYICVFSVYNQPGVDTRQLVVTDKETGEKQIFILEHCTAVFFSVADNARFRHSIVTVSADTERNECVWLGVTLRCSDTYVRYTDSKAYFVCDDKELVLFSTKDSARELYKERSLENKTVSAGKFVYSAVVAHSTISPSDVMVPLPLCL